MTANRKKILVIDDESNILKSLQRILEDKYDVTVSLGAQFVLDSILNQNTEFDFILCDLSMPGINGADFYHIVLDKYPHLVDRIIFITGGAYTAELNEFIVSVKNVCLAKPFEIETLYSVLDSFKVN